MLTRCFTYLLTLAMLALVTSAHAQYEPKPEAQMPAFKHSIGLNLTPAAVILMNGMSNVSRFSLIYTHQRAPYSRWRVTTNYEILDFQDETLSEAAIVAISGDDITLHQDRVFHSIADVRVGMEWHKPDRTFTMVYGVDLYGGIRSEKNSYVETVWTLTPYGYQPSGQPSTSFSHATGYALFGGSVSIGQQIQVKEHLRMEIRWTPEFGIALPISESISDPEQRIEAPAPQLGFRPRGLEVYAFLSF